MNKQRDIVEKLFKIMKITQSIEQFMQDASKIRATDLSIIYQILCYTFGQDIKKVTRKDETINAINDILHKLQDYQPKFDPPKKGNDKLNQIYQELAKSFNVKIIVISNQVEKIDHHIDYNAMMAELHNISYKFKVLQSIALFRIEYDIMYQMPITIPPLNNICYVAVLFQEIYDAKKCKYQLTPVTFTDQKHIFYLNGIKQEFIYNQKYEMIKLNGISTVNNYVDLTPLCINKTKDIISCYCAIYLAEEQTIEMLFEQISKKPAIASQFFKPLLNSNNISFQPINQDDVDVEVNEVQYSLRSQISLKRIKFPVRSIKCKHDACIDLAEYEDQGNEICYVCSQHVSYQDFRVDAIAQYLLKNNYSEKVKISKDGEIEDLEQRHNMDQLENQIQNNDEDENSWDLD